jgi:hypothetical protein
MYPEYRPAAYRSLSTDQAQGAVFVEGITHVGNRSGFAAGLLNRPSFPELYRLKVPFDRHIRPIYLFLFFHRCIGCYFEIRKVDI